MKCFISEQHNEKRWEKGQISLPSLACAETIHDYLPCLAAFFFPSALFICVKLPRCIFLPQKSSLKSYYHLDFVLETKFIDENMGPYWLVFCFKEGYSQMPLRNSHINHVGGFSQESLYTTSR